MTEDVAVEAVARPGWKMSPTCVKLRTQLQRYVTFHQKRPGKWLMAPRVASQIVEELKPLLVGEGSERACATDLSELFGVPVELVPDLPQGAVLR